MSSSLTTSVTSSTFVGTPVIQVGTFVFPSDVAALWESINSFPPPLTPVSFVHSLRLVALPPFQGVGFSRIPQRITSILPFNYFTSQKVTCYFFVYLWPYSNDLFLISIPSHPLYLWYGLLQPWGWFFFSLELLKSPDQKAYVSLVCFWWAWLKWIHESLGPSCWLCLGHHDPPNMNQTPLCGVFSILDDILSLFTL